MDKRSIKFAVYLYSFIFALVIFQLTAVAAENPRIKELGEKVINSKTADEAYPALEELTAQYFKENKYNECVNALELLAQKNKELQLQINYYIGLTRYYQLKYLEQSQNWEEYFNQGNTYKEQVKDDALKVISGTKQQEALAVYSRLLLWMFYRDQGDALESQAAQDLITAVSKYAESALDLTPIKDAADKLAAYGEKTKSAQLYKIYADKLVSSGAKDDDIKELAEKSLKESNMELSQTLFDIYIGRIIKSMPKDKAAPILIDIAKKFVYRDQQASDPMYAEKIFSRIDELGMENTLDSGLLYIRAFNLEKAREYAAANNRYLEFVNRFPLSEQADKVNYKIGIIDAYALRDIKSAKEYLEKLAKKDDVNAYVIGSLYQLGVLNQWENALDKAKDYYNRLITSAGDSYSDMVSLAKQRLAEIDAGKPMDYNLKVLLDVSLKPEYASLDMKNSQLQSSAYLSKAGQEIKINAMANMPESGCMQVQAQYLWSGQLGSSLPAAEQASFSTSYKDSGTKIIGVVVASPNGFIDRGIEIIDVE